MLERIKNFMSHPKDSIRYHVLRMPFLPDRLRIEIMWRQWMNYPLNLKKPTTFNEKLQWLKLYDRNPLYTKLVDKYAVKDYVASVIGREYIIPTIAVWDKVEDIDLSMLPNQFVLKTTHDSGGVCICRDKDSFDFEKAKEKLDHSLHYDYYKLAAEWPYKNVYRRIMAEEYLEPAPNVKDLFDYKFFCFDGEVKFFKIDFNRESNHRANYYDRNGKLMPFGEVAFPPEPDKKIKLPSNLQEMIKLAERLSQEKHFCRIDLYNIKEKVYFGEITLYPAGGFGTFVPNNFDEFIENMLTLPEKRLGGAFYKIIDSDEGVSIEMKHPDLPDYKFFCFDGECKALFIATDRQNREEPFFSFFDRDFNFLGITQGHPQPPVIPEKPQNYDLMIELAEKLSKGFPQVRVDFYEVNGKVYFGELTFFHHSGIVPFEPQKWDYIFGEWLKLPKTKRR